MEENSQKASMATCETDDEEFDPTEEYDGDVDNPDGFGKFLLGQFAKLSCISENFGGDDHSAAPFRSSTSSENLQEDKTALTTSEVEGHGVGDSDTYSFTYRRRGLAVIINNEKFFKESDGKSHDRPGSSRDRKSLSGAFQHLGFKVLVYNNLKSDQMLQVLRQAATGYDHTSADCLACAILTHGHETWRHQEMKRRGTRVRHDMLFGVDWKSLATKDVLQNFSDERCPGLIGKPRLFFFQACRGHKQDDGTAVEVSTPRNTQKSRGSGGTDSRDEESSFDHTGQGDYQRSESFSSSVDPPQYHKRDVDSVDAKAETQTQEGGKGVDVNLSTVEKVTGPSGSDQIDARGFPIQNLPVSPAPLYKDFLVMYATSPGYYAWRRPQGSWFVQELCQILQNRSLVAHKSLLNVLVQVMGHVTRDYQSQSKKPHLDKKKECPVIESMLVKDIFFKKK